MGDDAFAAPTEAPAPHRGLRALGRLLVQRVLRIGASVAVLALLGSTLGDPDLLPAYVVGGVALWLPTTALLLRVTLWPSPPHPRLRTEDGRAASVDDVLVLYRVGLAEHLLGTLPLLLVGPLAFGIHPLAGTLATLVLGALVTRIAHRAVVQTEHRIARVEAATGRSAHARHRLERLLRLTFGAGGDPVLQSLARLHFGEGEVEPALSALQRIRSPERYHVGALRAQMLAGRDPDRALRALADPSLGPAQQLLVESLVDLHTDRVDRVRARADELAALAESEEPDLRSLLLLVRAAALAPSPEAVEALEASGWQAERLPWLEQVWPALAARVAPLPWPEPDYSPVGDDPVGSVGS